MEGIDLHRNLHFGAYVFIKQSDSHDENVLVYSNGFLNKTLTTKSFDENSCDISGALFRIVPQWHSKEYEEVSQKLDKIEISNSHKGVQEKKTREEQDFVKQMS